MQVEIDSRAGFAHRVKIYNICLAEINAVQNLIKVSPSPGREVVYAAYLLAAGG
jgi:hypothetical protein